MGLMTRFRAAVEAARRDSLENPAIPLSAAGILSAWLGGEPTASGEQVNLGTATQISTVYACVRVLAQAVGSLPLHVVKVSDTGRIIATDHWLFNLLRWEPNNEMTAVGFKEALVASMALDGNGYAEIQRDKNGRAVALWPLHPQLTKPVRLTNGDLAYETTDGMTRSQSRRVAAADMLHFALWSLNGIHGMSPIRQMRDTLGLAKAQEKFGAKYFGNGGQPMGILTYAGAMDPKQKAEAKEAWERAQAGERGLRTAVLGGGWDYKQISLDMEDTQFLAARQFQRAEIAAIFGVPPHMVGDTTRLSNNNHEQQSLSFVVDTLKPYLSRMENEIVRKLMPKVGRSAGGYEVEFDVEDRLRGDFGSMMTGFSVGRQNGFLSINDIRRKLKLDPIGPEGDVYLAAAGTQDVKRLLTTESSLDAPAKPVVDVKPAAAKPAGDDDLPEVDEDEGESDGEAGRSLIEKYAEECIEPFTEALKTVYRQQNTDLLAIRLHFDSLLAQIARLSMGFCGESAEPVPVVNEALRAMARRAEKWPAKYTDDWACQEFRRVVRGIHLNVAREAAAAKADRELGAKEQ